MARIRLFCLVLVCCVASTCATPGLSGAAQRAEFQLRGSKGFAAGFEVRKRRATLGLHRTFGSSFTPAGVVVQYFSHGSISGDRVRARFGGRGKIAVMFKARKTVRREPPSHCAGPPIVIRTGVFVGTIRFHGERGFTAVEAKRAQGKLRTIAAWECGNEPMHPTGPGRASEAGGPVLLKAKRQRKSFEVATDRPPTEEGATRFIVGMMERRITMRIHRGAYAYARESSFAFDRRLTRANVGPPRPFSGSAFFRHGPDRPTWTGSLSVELPGVGVVPLAGKGYEARLYRGRPEDSPGY